MKKIFILFFCTALFSFACQPKSDTTTTTNADSTLTDSTKTAQGKTYFCPMCTGQESDKPGKCTHCGMDLELKK